MSEAVKVRIGRVMTEGDEIHYECRGRGRPLLMISGGSGDAGIYTFVADMLADEFKVITYDRRGQSRSTRHDPQNFEISQQSRDAAAVIQAAGEESVLVFGSSSGALIALELARSRPELVQIIVAHEPPVLRVLPDADKWMAFIAQIYLTALTRGAKQALQDFLASIVMPPSLPDPKVRSSKTFQEIDERQQARGSSEFAMRYELLPSVNYKPDIGAIRKSGVKVVMAIGAETLAAGAYYGRTVPILAKQLDCEMATFPGHHVSYMINPREWTATLRAVLRKA